MTPTDNDVHEAAELRGWIQPCNGKRESDCRRELESIGVDVGLWDESAWHFRDCTVSGEAISRLDPLWGQYIWGLQ